MKMISTRTAALAASLMLALGGTALAQDQGPALAGGHGAFRAACGQDIQTYCSTAQSREDRHACMQTNKDKFSDTCKSFLASHMHGAPQPSGQ